MINAISILCLLSSLAAAGIFSPPPAKPQEGQRVIVVEYERTGIPQENLPTAKRILEEAKDKFHEAASHLPNVGQGISTPGPSQGDKIVAEEYGEGDQTQNEHHRSAKDLICDAYGRCWQRISGLVGKGAEKSEEKMKQAEESIDESQAGVRDASGNIPNAAETAADKVEETSHASTEKGKSARGRVMDKARNIVNRARHTADKAEGKGEATVDHVKHTGDAAVEKVKETGETVEEKVQETGEAMKRNLSDIARRAKEVAVDAAAYVGAPETARATAAVLHLLGFAVAYGAAIWVTFFSSHVLAHALPRQQFGIVQSKLYPVYFRVMVYGLVAAFVGHYWAENRGPTAERVQGYNLLASLALVLANMVLLEPRATQVMFERMKMEKEEGRGRDVADVVADPVATALKDTAVMPPEAYGVTGKTTSTTAAVLTKSKIVELNKKLKTLNSYSSFLNVLTLMGLSWHLLHLARSLTTNNP